MKRIFTLVLLFVATYSLHSQIVTEVPKIPSYIPNSNFGTEFYLATIPVHRDSWGNHWWSFYIYSAYETEVKIKNEDRGANALYKLTKNKIIRIPIGGWHVVPYLPFEGKSSEEKVYSNASLHITSKDPIAVFFDTDVAFTSDMFSLLPTSSWGKEYVVNTYYSHNWAMLGSDPMNIPSTTMILAGFDSTEVVFTMNGNDSTETLSGIKHGQSRKFLMNKGDVLPIATSMKQYSTIAGSRIVANKPIGVISGVQCADVPLDKYYCDNLLEMELPLHTWGKTFHITKNKNRKIGCLFQVVAKDPNTTLYINGHLLKVLENIDTTQLIEWAEFNSLGKEFPDNNFVLTADKPISVTTFNQSGFLDSSQIDPYQMVITPFEQYRKKIRSIKIDVGDGGGYSNYFLNIVYPLDSNLTMPQEMEWGESITDSMVWMPFKDKWGDTADYIFEGYQDGKKYAVKYLTLKKEESFQIQSNEKIAIYTYGHTPYKAFGVPAYLGLWDLTVQDSLPPIFNFVQSADGTIGVINGNEKAIITDLHHPLDSSSKLSMVYCQFSNTVNYDVHIDRFIPGDDATTYFTATVIDKSKDAQFVLTAIDRAGNDTTILITQKATISSATETELESVLRVIPSVTDKSPITIEIRNESTQNATLSIVSITGKTVYTFDNVQLSNGTQTIQFDTAELPIGMYYVVFSMNGKQYQQSFVKMK